MDLAYVPICVSLLTTINHIMYYLPPSSNWSGEPKSIVNDAGITTLKAHW